MKRHTPDDERDGPDENARETRIDINFSVTDLLSNLLDGADSTRRSSGSRPRGRPSRGPDETDHDHDYHVDSYRTDDELTIVADLLGTKRDDVTAGIDAKRGELVVAVGDRAVGRVPLPWDPVTVADTSFNNGVLQVRLRPGTDSR
ncbi:gas vesicle protein GvpH [Halogeometricum limi]|nr:gas vesicle protein GvpH [Halogeometricum limi]